MLRRATGHLALLILALLLVVVPGVLLLVGQTDWARSRVHEIVAQELANYFDREVSVGPLRGNLLDGVTIEGLAIAEGERLADGAIATADRVRIEYDLWSVLRGGLAPAASVSAVHIWGLRARIVRERTGQVNITRIIPSQRAVPLARRFRGRVFIHSGSAVYLDYGRETVNAPAVVHLGELRGAADFGRIITLVAELSARVIGHQADSLTARMHAGLQNPFFSLDARINNLNVAWLAGHLPQPKDVALLSGRTDVAGSLYGVPYLGKQRWDYSVALKLRDARIAGRGASGIPVVLNGGLWVANDMVEARGLWATVAGSRYEVAGSAYDLVKPKVDLAVTSAAANLRTLAQAVPAEARRIWNIPESGVAALTAQVVGPLTNPNLRATVNLPGQLAATVSGVGTIRVAGLSLQADVVSASDEPSVRGRMTAQRLSAPALQVKAGEDSLLREASVGPIEGFSANVQVCGGRPMVEATVRTPYLEASGVRLTELSSRVQLVNDVLRLPNLRAQALGGSVTADAAVLVRGPEVGVRARGSARGIDLARLRALPANLRPDVPEDLSGTANAEFQAHLTGSRFAGRVSFGATNVTAEGASAQELSGVLGLEGDGKVAGVGTITATNVQRESVDLDEVRALVRLQGDEAEVLSAYGRGPDGMLWARGDVNLEERTLQLQVRGAELQVASLAQRAGLDNISGIGYVSGEVSGSFNKPSFDGQLTVFEPHINETRLGALQTQVRYQGDQAVLTDLMASRGSAVIDADLTLSNLEGPQSQIALSGRASGQGLNIADLASLANSDLPVDGLAEFDAQVGGTWARPEARGTLRMANVRYDDFIVARVEAPFVFGDNRLFVSNATATVLDSPVALRGTVSFDGETELDVHLGAQRVRLEGLAPYLGTDLPIGGTVALEQAWVRGPTGNLQGGARLVAEEIVIGDETLGDLDATLSLSRGQVQLHETSFQIADGRVILSGAYNYVSAPDTIAMQAQLLQANLADLLYLAAPIAAAVDTRSPDERADLQLMLHSYALRFKGAVDGTLNVAGPVKSPTAVVDVEAPKLVLDGNPLPEIALEGTLTRQAAQNLVVSLRQGDALITADGDVVFDGPINLNVDGSGIKLAQLRPWIPLDIPYGGQLGFSVVASGMTREPDVMASVDISDPSFAGVQFDVLSVPVATVREGEADVDTLIIKRGETEIVLDGRLPFSWHLPETEDSRGGPGLIPNGQVVLGGRIDNTPLAFFLPLMDEYLRAQRPAPVAPTAEQGFRWASIKTEGQVNSAVSLTGTVAQPTLRGYLRMQDGAVIPSGWKTGLTNLTADLQFSGTGRDNLVEVQQVSARYDQTQANLTGRLWLTQTDPEMLWRNPVDLRLALQTDTQTLPGGTAITGLDGALTVRTEDGVQVVRPENLAASVGGGRTELTGEARLTQFRRARLGRNDFDLHLQMEPGRVRYAPFIDAMLSGQASLVSPETTERRAVPALTGKWLLTDGSIGMATTAANATGFSALSSDFPSANLDVTVGLGEDMQLRGLGLRAALTPNPTAAHLTGTPQQPYVVGQITTERGTATLPTATLRLRELAVNYFIEPLPGDRSDPQKLRLRGPISGEAETTVSRPGATPIRVVARISGSLPDQVQIDTYSDPPLTETQIFALLGGVPFAYLPGMGGEGDLGEVVSEQFLSTLATAFKLRFFQPIEEELQRALGLELGITFAFNQPVTLQVGKYVLRNLLITYERPLVEGGSRYDLRLSYELPHGLRITYHNDERNINQIEMGYHFTF